MIRGVRITEIPLIKAQLKNHYKKLRGIKDQRKKYFSLDLCSLQSQKKTKENHNYVLGLKKQNTQKKLAQQNNTIFNRLLQINNRKPQFSIAHQKLGNHGKSFIYRKRQQMAIQSTNESIVSRIMNKTGFIDHNKDLQQFNKTRQVVNRLQKFRITQKMMNLKKRSYTLPPKINLNIQTQTEQV